MEKDFGSNVLASDKFSDDLKEARKTELRKVPVLSLHSYTNGNQQEQVQFILQLFSGLKDYGFVILRDHEVQESLLRQAYGLVEQFFASSNQSKMKYSGIEGGQRGYTPFGTEHAKDAKVMDLKEFWHIGQELAPEHPLYHRYPKNVWPDELSPEFFSVFHELYQSLEKAGRAILQALTFPLDVDQQYFDRMTEDGNSILRLLHYPPIPAGTDPRCLRAAAHEDINLITLLPAATASGLQLKDRDGSWLDIESEWGSLIVDTGDMLARITGDLLPATTHRVVNVETGKSRYSMPFFMHPHPDAILSGIPSCHQGVPNKYPDITAQDFLMQRLREIGLLK